MTYDRIRIRLADIERQRSPSVARLIVGAAFCESLSREADEERTRLLAGEKAKSPHELLVSATTYMEANWPALERKADQDLSREALDTMQQTISDAIEIGLSSREKASNPIFFAIWTGVIANFVWLIVGAGIIFLAWLLKNGVALQPPALGNIS